MTRLGQMLMDEGHGKGYRNSTKPTLSKTYEKYEPDY